MSQASSTSKAYGGDINEAPKFSYTLILIVCGALLVLVLVWKGKK